MERHMKDAGLETMYDEEDWPTPNAVKKLFTRLELLKKQTGVERFLAVDLRECAVCLRNRCTKLTCGSACCWQVPA